jgi:Family of unknown function (DUF5677)
MSDLVNNGFLADLSDWTKDYHAHFRPWLELCKEFNSFAQDVFFRCEVQSNDLRRSLAKTLFMRSLGNYQAAYLLGERGMEAQSEILVRSLCEATFALVAIAKDPSFAKRYARHNEAKRLQNIESMLGCKSEYISAEMRDEILREQAILRAKKAADGEMKIVKLGRLPRSPA